MRCAGVLLTGGGSVRLGFPKAELLLGGERLVDRTARILEAVCAPVVEAGPGWSRLDAVGEDPAGEGPLAAVVAAAGWLGGRGPTEGVIVVSVDLPHLETELLRWLADHPAHGSVVPVVDGRAQSLCARYAGAALITASALVARGERSMHALLDEIDVAYADESEWSAVCEARAFEDVDTPADAERLGLSIPPGRR